MNIRFLGCGLVASFLGRKGGLGPDYNCSPFDGSLVKILALPVGMQEVQAPAYFFKQNYIFFFRYRKDLNKAAIKRAAIIVRSQKPLPTRKGGNKTAATKKSD